MDNYLGKRLDGRYEMRELIGVGGMAYVYKAYDAVDDRIVAVKILREEFLSNEEFTRRFRNESKAIAILNHPNIVKVLDVGFGERLQYIVMEHIDGITLKEYLDQRKDIRWKEAVHFAVQILRALQHAHDKGIVHRDIKPQNIMLLSDGTIKVTDFGIARLSRNEVRATVDGEKAIGSVHYISPEQARGEITDEKADLYSVGVMLYEMITGKLPFEADNAVSVAIMQMQSEAALPRSINEDIPEGLEQITMKAMQKDTAKRYQSAAEMLSDIDEFKRNPSIKFAYTYFVDETPTRYVDAITRVRGEDGNGESEADDNTGKSKVSMVVILSVVAACMVLVAGVIGVLFLTGAIGGSKPKVDEIKVDNFVGMDYTEGVLQHANIGKYTLAQPVEMHNGEYPAGVVFKQDPPADSLIKEKGTLTLYVSMGSRLEKVPSMTEGENVNMVRDRLTSAGFKILEVEESSQTVKAGNAIRLEPKPGTDAQYGSEIKLYISTGKPPVEPIDMPNIIGLEFGDARDRLVAAGFEASRIKEEKVNDKASAGTVISATPDHTVDQLPDVDITLTVSTGCQDVTVTMTMPSQNNVSVDVQFYIDNKLKTELSQSGILLKNSGSTLRFTLTETKSQYDVTVMVAEHGKNNFVPYAEFKVNAINGTYTEKYEKYPPASNSTTAASADTTTTANTTTKATKTQEN